MKIAYYLEYQFSKNNSTFKKLIQQLDEWGKSGHTCQLFVLTKKQTAFDAYSNFDSINYSSDKEKVNCNVITYNNIFDRYLKLGLLAINAITWSPDILYSRNDLNINLYKLILFRKVKTIVEINTDDLMEFNHFHKSWKEPIYKWYRKQLFKQIKGAVFVTYELQRSDSYNLIREKSIVISNGIPINDFKTLPKTNNETPVLSFLGTSDFKWHGIDKVVKMANLLPDYKFYIIGPSIEKYTGSIPDNVTFTGFLEYDEYSKHLAKTDIAIGTLALHRKGMNEACALKVREYLALGLPIILAYDDTDFPNDPSFIQKLPNSVNNIEPNISLIKTFTNSWLNKRVSKKLISHLDSQQKEKKRLIFFKGISNK